ncbi:MAG: hypothetical protein PHT33_15945, partial [bacterium]|nr:hypothetical protein [bacterium]
MRIERFAAGLAAVLMLSLIGVHTSTGSETGLIAAGGFEEYTGRDLKSLLTGQSSLGIKLDPYYELTGYSIEEDLQQAYKGKHFLRINYPVIKPKMSLTLNADLLRVPIEPVNCVLAARGKGVIRIGIHYFCYEGPERKLVWKGSPEKTEITVDKDWKEYKIAFPVVPEGIDRVSVLMQFKPRTAEEGVSIDLDEINAYTDIPARTELPGKINDNTAIPVATSLSSVADVKRSHGFIEKVEQFKPDIVIHLASYLTS